MPEPNAFLDEWLPVGTRLVSKKTEVIRRISEGKIGGRETSCSFESTASKNAGLSLQNDQEFRITELRVIPEAERGESVVREPKEVVIQSAGSSYVIRCYAIPELKPGAVPQMRRINLSRAIFNTVLKDHFRLIDRLYDPPQSVEVTP